jgi:hypothetical protein
MYYGLIEHILIIEGKNRMGNVFSVDVMIVGAENQMGFW